MCRNNLTLQYLAYLSQISTVCQRENSGQTAKPEFQPSILFVKEIKIKIVAAVY